MLENGSGDTPVPDAITIKRLPESIEKYYRQATGQPTIRVLTANKNLRTNKSNTGGYNRGITTPKPASPKFDRPCPTCHAWGHLKNQCGGFARFLIFQEASTNVDDIQKSKLITNYKADMKAKGEARLHKQKLGTVRQMWEQGCSYDEVEENLLSMVLHEPTGMSLPSDDEEAE